MNKTDSINRKLNITPKKLEAWRTMAENESAANPLAEYVIALIDKVESMWDTFDKILDLDVRDDVKEEDKYDITHGLAFHAWGYDGHGEDE
jgi:hypothetical protein